MLSVIRLSVVAPLGIEQVYIAKDFFLLRWQTMRIGLYYKNIMIIVSDNGK
jgi:hypothetical protein